MSDLIEPHEPVADCDCRACACTERNRLREQVKRADSIMLMLTADHNTGAHYLRGFEMASEYFADTATGEPDHG